MMPDAEPLAETIEADATVAAASEIVDVTDAAVAEPDTEQATDPDPDAATDGGSESAGSTPLADVPRADRRDRLRKVGAIVFITVVVLGAATVTVTRSPFFAARTIEVRGVSHVPRSQVLRIAAVTSDTNVFTLDAGAAERRLERDPWIAGATVTKDLPSTLVVDIHERIAVAVAESDGVLWLVADDGAFLETALPRDAIGMPSIVSADAEGAEPTPEAVGGAARAIAAMAPTLRRRIDGISILADGQLRVDLNSGSSAAYGEPVELQEKAMALRALLDYAAERGATVVSVDVRVPSAPTALLVGGEVVTP
jgi:cell division protein FtsQ